MLADALCRLAADVPKTSPHKMPQLTCLVRRTLLARNAALPAAAALSRAYAPAFSATRSYATTTRATKPTTTVKKAVKAEAAEKPAPKKAASAKKPVGKKKTTAAKKPAAKKKKKKKTAAKKPAAKKTPRRVKRELTDEEKEKAKIRELRVKALREPASLRPITAYNVFLGEATHTKPDGVSAVTALRNAAEKFKSLTPAELEHYNQVARQKTEVRKAEYQRWIHSHTPLQIRIANVARASLRRKLASTQKRGPAHTSKLYDDRHVKPVPSAYVLFFKARHDSGDMKNIKITDATKLIGSEWKALSASEKKKYEDEVKAIKEQAAAA